MYCASRIYTFQQLAWQQFIKHSITNIFFGSAETEVSSLTGSLKHDIQMSPTARGDGDIICRTSWWTMTAVRGQTAQGQRTRQWSSVHHITTDTCVVLQHCSKPAIRESARDSTAHKKDKQRTFHNITFWLCHCVHNNFIENPRQKNLTE